EENELSELIIISNNDIKLDGNNFLFKFIRKYEDLPSDKAFASPVMYVNNQRSIVAARKLPPLMLDIIWSSVILSKLFNKNLGCAIPKEVSVLPVDSIPGSFFIGSISLFKDVGYFDEELFLFG